MTRVPPWTGFAGKTLWNWLELLVIPLALAAVAFGLNYFANERDQRREDQRAARERAIAADGSLRQLWELNADPRGAALTIEFVALANHRKAIRAEIARYAERFRAAQLGALTAALERHGVDEVMPPIVALLLMTGVTQMVAIEQALGVTAGHDTTLAYIADAIGRIEAQ